jgi:Toprim domain
MSICSPSSLATLAVKLNGNVSGGWINIRGPKHSGADRSLGFRFDKGAPDGIQVYSFSGDDPDECRQYVLELLEAISSDTKNLIGKQADVKIKVPTTLQHAKNVLNNSYVVGGSASEKYLKTRNCWTEGKATTSDLLFNPKCRFNNHICPALIGIMRNVFTGAFSGVLRTAIEDDGSGKIIFPDGTPSKMILGTAKHAAVKLFPLAPIMGVAEGIETALSAARIFNIPVWALLSSGGISYFPIISAICDLTIFADKDETGLRAATECARRYKNAGVQGKIRVPPDPFNDWNDFIVSEGVNYGCKN